MRFTSGSTQDLHRLAINANVLYKNDKLRVCSTVNDKYCEVCNKEANNVAM